MSYKECFEENFTMTFNEGDNTKYGLSIKSDETFINPRLRYNSKTNQIVGPCYEHHGNINLNFDTMADAENLQKHLSDGKIHLPKECLVTGKGWLSIVHKLPFDNVIF